MCTDVTKGNYFSAVKLPRANTRWRSKTGKSQSCDKFTSNGITHSDFICCLLLIFQFTEIMFVDHQTGNKIYFKRLVNQSITAADNYGKNAGTYGKWNSVGANNAYDYQLLICHTSFYAGFFVSGHTQNCYKDCNSWCSDGNSPYFRTASSDKRYLGVAFNTNGHRPLSNRLISVGLR